MTKMNKSELAEQGKRLKLFRNSLDMTQDEFGTALDRDQTSINKYELGLNSVPSSIVKKLNGKFQMSIDWFYYGNGPKKASVKKGSLVKDLGTLNTNVELLELKVEKLEQTVNKLVTELYALKHSV